MNCVNERIPRRGEYLWWSYNLLAEDPVMATEAVRLDYTKVAVLRQVQKCKKIFGFNVDVRAKPCYYSFIAPVEGHKKGATASRDPLDGKEHKPSREVFSLKEKKLLP
ncbi:MAG: hypothetical protein F6J93_07735 [Oscillatoria sp. SIO1A7]|nr:hypothetical protein [Oscillatoria sp. SIO1A7]